MKGYVAITSAFIITALILVIVLGVSLSAVLTRENILSSDLKETSKALAEACAETALLKLAQNSSYAGNETITVAASTCSIVAVVASGTQKIITTTGRAGDVYTNLRVTASSSPVLSISGWEEVVSF